MASFDDTKECILAGNAECGVSQSKCGNTLTVYAGGQKAVVMNATMMYINTRVSRTMGAAVTEVDDMLTLGAGNLFMVTANPDIKWIATDGWNAGANMVLIFTSAVKIWHMAPDPPAGKAQMKLNASADFDAIADSTLSFVYNGQYWYEVGRKI